MAVSVIEILLLVLACAHLIWSFDVAPEIRIRQVSLIGYVLVLVLAAFVPPAAALVAFFACALGVGIGALRREDGIIWLQATLAALACAMVLPERWFLVAVVLCGALLAAALHATLQRRAQRLVAREARRALDGLGEWGQMDERFDFAWQLLRDGRTARLHDERIAAYRQALMIARQIARQQPEASPREP